MFGPDLAPGGPFLKRSRILGHAKTQQARLVPDRDWLNKVAGRKPAIAYRAGPAAVDASFCRIRQTCSKYPLAALRKFRERDHMLPDLLRRSMHDDLRRHEE